MDKQNNRNLLKQAILDGISQKYEEELSATQEFLLYSKRLERKRRRMKKILLFILTRSGADPISEPAERILEYVRENYRNRIRNDELAKYFGYHPNHLNRVVKSYTGMPVISIILPVSLSASRLIVTLIAS